MFSPIGNLNQHWHVIALASEVKSGKSLKRRLYDQPILIWRDKAEELHALLDCCAHKKSPLVVKDFSSNEIVCPYHGWRYDVKGDLTYVPSAHSSCEELKCSIPRFRIAESMGFVWIYLGDDVPVNEVPELGEFADPAWGVKFKRMAFETTEELLIDNFMDPTHTALVHDGLIRSSDKSMDHKITITTHEQGVRVDFEEQEESIGFGMRLLFGRSVKVSHTDEFLLPNLVKVTYRFNGEARFLALIACSPTGKLDGGQTQAFVQLRYRFGVFNYLASPILPFLASKVLKQDFEITQMQFVNMSSCQESKSYRVTADAVAVKIAKLRSQLISGGDPVRTSKQELELRF